MIDRWIGNNLKQIVTVINTHSLEDELDKKKIEDIVDALKENIRYALVFIIVFKQWDNEMNPSMRAMLSLVQKMFGKKFSEHTYYLYWGLPMEFMVSGDCGNGYYFTCSQTFENRIWYS